MATTKLAHAKAVTAADAILVRMSESPPASIVTALKPRRITTTTTTKPAGASLCRAQAASIGVPDTPRDSAASLRVQRRCAQMERRLASSKTAPAASRAPMPPTTAVAALEAIHARVDESA